MVSAFHLMAFNLITTATFTKFTWHNITHHASHHASQLQATLLGRHGSDSLCRDERENKMAATYNVLAFKR